MTTNPNLETLTPTQRGLRDALLREFKARKAKKFVEKQVQYINGNRQVAEAIKILFDEHGQAPHNAPVEDIIEERRQLEYQIKWFEAMVLELQTRLLRVREIEALAFDVLERSPPRMTLGMQGIASSRDRRRRVPPRRRLHGAAPTTAGRPSTCRRCTGGSCRRRPPRRRRRRPPRRRPCLPTRPGSSAPTPPSRRCGRLRPAAPSCSTPPGGRPSATPRPGRADPRRRRREQGPRGSRRSASTQLDAYLQISRSAGLPQVGHRSERTRDTLSQNRQVPLAPGTNPVSNNYQIGLAASWELDLWGKVARSNEAAYADLVSADENRRALVQSLVSDVAATYVRLLAVDRELELLRDAIGSNREAVQLAETAFRNGGNSELPVLHALAELQQRQSDVPGKEAERAALENALSILLGRNPGPMLRGRQIAELALPPVPGGLPADLLAQRPDVRRAEQDLVAANARIGVAWSQYLPTISLTATNGFASSDLSLLDKLSSNFGSFGVAVFGPVYTGGRIAGQRHEAEALQQQAATTYLKSVQTALREVDDALTAHGKLSEQIAIRNLQVESLREQRDLARKRYDNGYTSFFPVIDAEQALTAGQLLQNESRREQFRALIAVYKAMGGGWALPELSASRAPSPKTIHD